MGTCRCHRDIDASLVSRVRARGLTACDEDDHADNDDRRGGRADDDTDS